MRDDRHPDHVHPDRVSAGSCSSRATGSGWNLLLDLVVPPGAIAICGYTLYKSIFPTPAYTGIVKWAPWVALIWLGIGIVIDVVLTITSPERVRRFGSILGSSEGASDEVPESAPMPAS